MPGLEVKQVLAELRERIIEECDYELEASNHRQIERYWRGHPFVLVPAVDTELSRRRVLVTDWVDGMCFDDVASAAGSGPRPLRRDRLPLLLRDRNRTSDSGSGIRTRATTCSARTVASRSSTSG